MAAPHISHIKATIACVCPVSQLRNEKSPSASAKGSVGGRETSALCDVTMGAEPTGAGFLLTKQASDSVSIPPLASEPLWRGCGYSFFLVGDSVRLALFLVHQFVLSLNSSSGGGGILASRLTAETT